MATRGFKCQYCSRSMRTEEGLDQHQQALHYFPCPSCSTSFTQGIYLECHQKCLGHCYCKKCEQFFVNGQAFLDHQLKFHPSNQLLPSSFSGTCPSCRSHCVHLKRHQEMTGHSYCIECRRAFASDSALADHQLDKHYAGAACPSCEGGDLVAYKRSNDRSFCKDCERNYYNNLPTQFRCCDCERDFVNESALNQHLASKIHVSPRHLETVCEECDKEFKSENALRQHMASVKHAPLCNVNCVAHKKCKRHFNCPSGLVQHLESGACRSGLNRQKINKVVQQKDTARLITGPDILEGIEFLGDRSSATTSSARSVIYTPDTSVCDASSDSGTVTPGAEPLTPSSGSSGYGPERRLSASAAMKCPLCPKRKAFRSFRALEDHLTSPMHAPKIFHCPTALAPVPADESKALKHFSTLSGLTQHLESGACNGGEATLQRAVRHVEQSLKQMGIKDLRLLNR